jgi:hypothetical protein
MDGIEAGINLPQRYDKYYICWETFYRHLLSMINQVPEDDNMIEEEPEELEEIEEPTPPIVEHTPTKEEISAYLESLKPATTTVRSVPTFKKPLVEVKTIEPPKMPPPKVSAIVRPIAPSGQKNSKPVYVPPTIDEDVDLLDDG